MVMIAGEKKKSYSRAAISQKVETIDEKLQQTTA